MSSEFKVEYFTDVSSGPRYVVDAETGDIRKDSSFISGDAAISEDASYPGNPETLQDIDAAKQAYEELLDSGLESGEFYKQKLTTDERGVRVQMYDEESEDLERVEEVDREFIDRAVEDIEEAF